MTIEENVLLSTLTTFRTGGPARFLLSLDAAEELPEAVRFAEEKKLPLIPLGGGSNLLAPDEGVAAVFVKLNARRIESETRGSLRRYTAEAGTPWDALAARAVAEGAWGLENLSGIPGTVGAAAVQNIGAYGAALSDVLESVTAFDVLRGALRRFSKDECRFGYRASVFKKEPGRYVIVELALALSGEARPNISYRDLARRFAGSAAPPLSGIRAAVLAIRAEKFPPLARFGTAGSFFLNPVLPASEAERVRARYPDVPLFDLPEGGVKVPLAWFLDRVLSVKGMREGGAFAWEHQPLVLAAERGARAADVRALAGNIAALVKEKIGFAVVPEVRVLEPDGSAADISPRAA